MQNSNVYSLFGNDAGHSLDDQLAVLAEVVQSFASSLDVDETLHNAIGKFIQYLSAEAASIFLLSDDKSELVCRACAGPVDITGLRLPATAGIVGKTVSTRSSQFVRDVRLDPAFAQNVDKDTGFETRSILCAPLMVQENCIGALELINKKIDDGLFDKRDENILVALASTAALAIHNARMANRLVIQERMQKELELAREIQEGLLPGRPEEDYPVQGMNIPAREVSGDFYDFFTREDGLIYFNLADVSGKGMNAALLMAKVSSLLHLLARDVSDPGLLLARVNEEVCETVSHGMFVTLVSGFVDPVTQTVCYANAGHQPPLFRHQDGRFEEIEAMAPPVGIMSGTEFPVTTISLQGGSLYLFTDGVTESANASGEEVGVEGLKQLIVTNQTLNGLNRLETIVDKIRNPLVSQHDDITIVMIECK